MDRLIRWLAPTTTARAHCDLPCGVYDPGAGPDRGRIVLPDHGEVPGQRGRDLPRPGDRDQGRARRAGQAPLDVLWHDYFKPEHIEKVPNLHELFWNATKAASKVKASVDPADGQKLLDLIDDIDAAWKATGGEEKTRVAGRPA